MTTAKNRPRRTRQAGAAGLLLATGLSIAVTPPPAQAAQGVTSLAQVDCVDSTRLAQIRGDGTQLWLSSLTRSDSDQPTVYGWQKIYTFNQQAASVAMLSSDDAINRMLVSFTDGSLRSYTWNTDTRTMVVKDLTPDAADKKYDFRRLTYDGTRLYGNKGTDLYVMTSISTTAAPTAMSKVSGWGGYARSFFGNSATPNGELSWTGTDGKLRIGDVRNTTDGWTVTTRAVADKLYPEHTITSPGGGILLRTVNTGALWRHHLNTDATTTSTHQTLATTTGAPDLPITTSPDVCTSQTAGGGPVAVDDLDYADLAAMFPVKVGTDRVRVDAGLPGLKKAMAGGRVTTTARAAAFLASVAAESNFYYDITEIGQTAPYKGRGFMQITGESNYAAAGAFLGTSFVDGNQERIRSLTWSAPAALWHWNHAWGSSTSSAADQHDMGEVSSRVGFAGSSDPNNAERLRRCADFTRAYTYLSGAQPTDVRC